MNFRRTLTSDKRTLWQETNLYHNLLATNLFDYQESDQDTLEMMINASFNQGVYVNEEDESEYKQTYYH